MSLRKDNAFIPPHKHDPNYLVGNDLTEEMLDELYDSWYGNQPKDHPNHMKWWWADKPHQIAHRLLMRLTRAETRIKELEAELKALKH